MLGPLCGYLGFFVSPAWVLWVSGAGEINWWGLYAVWLRVPGMLFHECLGLSWQLGGNSDRALSFYI